MTKAKKKMEARIIVFLGLVATALVCYRRENFGEHIRTIFRWYLSRGKNMRFIGKHRSVICFIFKKTLDVKDMKAQYSYSVGDGELDVDLIEHDGYRLDPRTGTLKQDLPSEYE